MRIWTALLFLATCSPAADVHFSFTDGSGRPVVLRPYALYPINAPFIVGTNIVTRDRIFTNTAAEGSIVLSNLAGGDWRTELQGTWTATTNFYRFPTNSGLVEAKDYLSVPTNAAGIVAYSAAVSDARFVAIANGNATNTVLINPTLGMSAGQFAFEFPRAGVNRHFQNGWESFVGASYGVVNNTSSNLIFQASGAGVVKEMQFVFQADSALNGGVYGDNNLPWTWLFKDLNINIQYDGSATVSTRFNLADVLGWHYCSQLTNMPQNYQSQFVVMHDRIGSAFSLETTRSFGNTNASSTWARPGFTLRFPIPFTNGILISLQLTNRWSDLDSAWKIPADNIGYSVDTMWQDAVTGDPINNLRLYCNVFSNNVSGCAKGAGTVQVAGTNVTGSGTSFAASNVGQCIVFNSLSGPDALITAVADTTHLTIAPMDAWTYGAGQSYWIAQTTNWFVRAAGKVGYIAGVVWAFDNNSNTGNTNIGPTFEANIRMFVDQEAVPSIEWTSTEEFFTSSYNWQHPFWQMEGGVINLFHLFGGTSAPDPVTSSLDDYYACTMYRWFKNAPIRYSNGIKAMTPVYAPSGWGANMHTTFNIATFYYE